MTRIKAWLIIALLWLLCVGFIVLVATLLGGE